MIQFVMMTLLSVFVSCSKAQENKREVSAPETIQKYYRFKDQEWPWTIVMEDPTGKFVAHGIVDHRIIGAGIVHYGKGIDEKYLDNSGMPHDGGISIEVDDKPFLFNLHGGQEFKPTFCFVEASPYQNGYRVNLNLLTEQPDGTFVPGSLPATLYVNHMTNTGEISDDEEPGHYPGGAFRELQVIIAEFAPGDGPKDKKLVLDVEYPAIFPDDPDNLKVAKTTMRQQLCEAVKTFTWVKFQNFALPPQWGRLPFKDTPQGQEWPTPEIVGR